MAPMIFRTQHLNRSIAKSSLVVLAVSVCFACDAPKKLAYIDVDRALAASYNTCLAIETVSVPGGNQLAGTSSKMVAKPIISLSGSGAEKRLADARAEIEKQRADALELLSKQVFESFLRDVERFRLKSNSEIENSLRGSLHSSTDQISILLKEYAEKRWPAANRLALLVRFPFPVVDDVMLEGNSKIIQNRNNEVRTLYKKLDEVSNEYQMKVQEVFNQLFSAAAQSRLGLGLRVVEMLDEADRKARGQANTAISGVNEDVLVLLASQNLVQLPILPESAVSIQSNSQNRLTPLGAKPDSPAIITKREEVEADLKIWLGIHARQLVTKPGNAPDETENFIEWRNQSRRGR